jgi:hypothetical protein
LWELRKTTLTLLPGLKPSPTSRTS